MNLPISTVSTELYVRMLRNLMTWLERADTQASARRFDPVGFLSLKLAPDMLPFKTQVVIACELARIGAAKLAGIELPAAAGSDDSLDGLRAKVSDAITFVEAITSAQLEGAAVREVVVPQRQGAALVFTGESFLQRYSLPNFFFHVTSAYALLRHAGVELGKADYLGSL